MTSCRTVTFSILLVAPHGAYKGVIDMSGKDFNDIRRESRQ